jgi:hypothetical protein
VNVLRQNEQVNGRSPVWTIKCCFSSWATKNALEHNWHWYGRSFMCIRRKWSLNSDGFLNDFEQNWQACGRPPPCPARWSSISFRSEYFLWHMSHE